MAGNLEYLLEQGECIPEDMLLEYAEGGLSSPQSHLVEKHLLECEFCSDALEGLKMMHPSKSKDLVAELNSVIDSRIQSTGNSEAGVIPFNFNYKIAAGIALFILFGGGYLFFKNRSEEKMLTQNSPPPASAITDSISPQLVPQTNSDQKSADPVVSQPKFSLAEKKPTPPSQKMLTENKDVQQANEIRKNEDDLELSQNDISKNNSAITVEKETTENPAKRQDEVSGEVNQAAKAAPAVMESVAFDKDSKARKNESANENAAAPPDLFSLNVLFTKAKNKYNKKKYAEAAIDFEKLMNDTATSFYDDAKWFLANCYMRTSENAKAVKLLREIAHSSSIHNKEAEGLLQE